MELMEIFRTKFMPSVRPQKVKKKLKEKDVLKGVSEAEKVCRVMKSKKAMRLMIDVGKTYVFLRR